MINELNLIIEKNNSTVFEKIYWPPAKKNIETRDEFEEALSELFSNNSKDFWIG